MGIRLLHRDLSRRGAHSSLMCMGKVMRSTCPVLNPIVLIESNGNAIRFERRKHLGR